MCYDSYPHDDANLASLPGVTIAASVMNPTGGGARTPEILLNESAHRLDGLSIEAYEQSKTFQQFPPQISVPAVGVFQTAKP
jgi:hypothetical protein